MAKSNDKDLARKIWLAGIGAYGRAFSEAKGAVDSLTGKSSEVFDELVNKGEMVEMVGKFKAEELLGKGKAAVEDIKPDFDIDDRIARMRERLSGVNIPGVSLPGAGDSAAERLSARVDQLEAKLDAVLAHLEIGDAPAAKKKSAPKKPAVKKRMTTQRTMKQSTAPKAGAKKTTTKKAAPKKTTAKKPAAKTTKKS